MPEAASSQNLTSAPTSTVPAETLQAWRIGVQERSLERILALIQAAETKASTILAIGAGMIATLVALLAQRGAGDPHAADWFIVGVLAPALSFVLVGWSAFPRTKGPEGSLIFFKGIARRSPSAYAADVAALSPTGYLQDLSGQCRRNAEIAARKYELVGYATVAVVLGVGPWLAALYFLILG